ncbi:TPR repeat region-containing protein [Mycolicibacterium baixiangningiae]|uniref:TPR repeat region-containing protein n=1 Tax=Mycolicibacterium baixiangningiae TaxID=2761578 RepID=UPI0018663EBE|nr:EspA/EspE family type VII secretion system effector [Mycolicibacterium baixiangningiae]
MSALDGFYTTWDNARETFGQGTPQSGTDFDKSPQLTNLGSGVTAAAPGSTWSGAAAANYDKANTDHQKVFTQLAELDRKIAQQVDQSAQVVATGRQNLDQVRQWVTDTANSVPPGKQRDMFLMQIANKGLGQLTEVVQKTNAESNTVAQDLKKLAPEFDALARDQKFGNGEKDEKKDDPEIQLVSNEEVMGPTPTERQAEQDVQAALAGDQNAAARVEEVIGKIQPGQELSPEQGSYLSQMQAQQNGMTVEELKSAEERLGDNRDIIGDSWQLMSNDDVRFPKTETTPEAVDDPNQMVTGGFDQLPQSVQDTLNGAGDLKQVDDTNVLKNYGELQTISDIVKNGNDHLQTGTEIDRGLMRAADAVMDSDVPAAHASVATQGLFEAVAPDHQIIHDHVLGTHGSDGQDFLRDVNHMPWNDNGKAAGALFSWTHDNHLEPDIASATAAVYAEYLGAHKSDLMDIGGQTLGDYNPDLVKAYAHGLSPYVDDIASVGGDDGDGFADIDGSNSERPIGKGIFSILSTQEDAYIEFNSAADALAVDRSLDWATDVKNNVPVSEDDSRMADAAVLKGMVSAGAADAAHEMQQNAAEAQQWRETAYKTGIAALSGVSGPVGGPIVATFGEAMENSFVGPAPDTSTPVVPDMKPDEASRFAANALLATGAIRPEDVAGDYLLDGNLASREELEARGLDVPTDTDYSDDLNDYIKQALGGSDANPSNDFMYWYNMIVKIPGGGG